MAKRKTNRARVNDALREIRHSYKNTGFYKTFGTLHDDPDRPHISIPPQMSKFIKQEFDLWWQSWVEPKLQEIEALANPLSAEESDLIAGKAGV